MPPNIKMTTFVYLPPFFIAKNGARTEMFAK